MPPKNILVILIVAVFSLACYSTAAKNKYANLFAEALEVVHREALHPKDTDDLFAGAMNGMLKDLDKYSAFISGDQFQSFDEDLRQEFGGVGMFVEVDPETDLLMVLAPMPNTPAFEAGLQVGDLIVSIEGESTQGKGRSESVEVLRGPIGEPVNLEIKCGEQLMTKTLYRAAIPVESVHGDYRKSDGQWCYTLKEHPGIGYIRLSQFGDKSAVEVRSALEQIVNQIDGLILDIRANPGGKLDVAVAICDMFLPADKLIVETRGRKDRVEHRELSTSERVVPPSLPVCLIVDRYSASASEVVSSCLQDHDRAVVIGERTYGKGTVQDVIPIQRNQSVLKLTTHSYWPPSNNNIDRYHPKAEETGIWGVRPNAGFEIELSETDILNNLRYRAARDIEGLASGADELLSEIRSGDRRDAEQSEATDPPQTPQPDSDDETNSNPADPLESTDENHVDQPLQRAIEYLNQLTAGTRVAA